MQELYKRMIIAGNLVKGAGRFVQYINYSVAYYLASSRMVIKVLL